MRFSTMILVFGFAMFMVIGLSAYAGDVNTIENDDFISVSPVKDKIPSAVVVTNDGMFSGAGFTGIGTEGDPYILDGVTITTAVSGRGIWISSTSAHFVIQNCIVNLTSVSGSIGIYVLYSGNGTIYNCTILGVTGNGIHIQESHNMNITENTIYDCGTTGIYQYLSSTTDIINNTITDIVYNGIELNTCPNTTISENTIMRINEAAGHSNGKGIQTQQSDNLTITHNEIRSVTLGRGINCQSANNTVISNNLIWKAWTDGIYIYNIPSIEVSYNNISCIDYYGLEMNLVDSPYVISNRIYHGITTLSRGIYLNTVSNGTFEANDIWQFTQSGIYVLSSCYNNTFYDNNLGWPGVGNAYDDRSAAPTNNWTSNQFHDYDDEPYSISGSGGATDSSASLLSDTTAPTIDSPSDFTIKDTDTNKWVTWHPYDRFQGIYWFYINNSYQYERDWCNSSVSISIDSYPVGVYDFEIWVMDCTAMDITEDTIRVTILDTQDPVFTSATPDYTIEYGQRVWFNITATDDTPAIKRAYEDEGAPLWNDAWTSPLTLNWDNVFPSVGVHNYTIELVDKAGNSATATCIVTVEDTTAPTSPDFPTDFSVEAGETTWISYTLIDPHPNNYEIWFDNALQGTLEFFDGEGFAYRVDYSDADEHNLTLVVYDDYNNNVTLTCIVTYVDSTSPVITGPDDFGYEAGSSPLVNWSWMELNPENYTIYENGTQASFSTSFSGDIQHTLDGLDIGKWNITLVFYDDSGNKAVDELWVTVEDTTAPSLDGFSNLDVERGDVLQINWQVNDIDPWDQDGTWTVFVNNSQEQNGEWDSTQVSFSMGPEVGVYNVTVVVTDAYGNSVTFTTWVNCEDTTAPTLTGFTELSFELGSGQDIIWDVTDIDPWDQDGVWIVYLNGTEMTTGVWNSTQIKYYIEPEIRREYNLTVVVIDAYGNSDAFTTWLTVHDNYPPQLTTPEDQEITVGQDASITWTCSERDPASLVIYRNGTIVLEKVWNGSNVNYIAEGLAIGVYNFTLVLADGSGNSGSDTVLVTVVAATATTTTTTTTSTTTTETSTTSTDTTIPPPGDDTMMILIITGVGGVIVVVILIVVRKLKK